MRRKVAMLTVVAGLLGASPAWAINDPDVPATDCAPVGSQAVGHPAASVLNGTPAGPVPNPGRSEQGLDRNQRTASC